MLSSLDNEVVFKKAFTDKTVFQCFVKDILGLTVQVGKIETEKRFFPKIGNIDFELDIYAETLDKRMCIELQKVQYDYTHDRFLHYFLMLIAGQQHSAREYAVGQTVYQIIVMTLPYTLKDLTGRVLTDEMLITTFTTRNAANIERPLYRHSMVTLNPNHRDPSTPKSVKDWLDLIYESMHHPENPSINLQNVGIQRAAQLIEFAKLTPKQLAAKKSVEQAQSAKIVGEEAARWQERVKVAKKLHAKNIPLEMIANIVESSLEETQEMIDLSPDNYRQPFWITN
jgi:PD-(D/E)XK nuclease family transposase